MESAWFSLSEEMRHGEAAQRFFQNHGLFSSCVALEMSNLLVAFLPSKQETPSSKSPSYGYKLSGEKTPKILTATLKE